jgi:hypothetical protein
MSSPFSRDRPAALFLDPILVTGWNRLRPDFAQCHAVMHDPFPMQPLAYAPRTDQVDRTLFEESRANSRLDVLTGALLKMPGSGKATGPRA